MIVQGINFWTSFFDSTLFCVLFEFHLVAILTFIGSKNSISAMTYTNPKLQSGIKIDK